MPNANLSLALVGRCATKRCNLLEVFTTPRRGRRLEDRIDPAMRSTATARVVAGPPTSVNRITFE